MNNNITITAKKRHEGFTLTARIIHAMDKRVYKNIVKNNLQNALFDKLAITLGMSTFDNFWDDYIQMKNERYPDPTFITVYKARFDHGFTQQVLRSLAQDGLMRTNGGTPPLYALEDIELMKKIRSVVKEFRTEKVLQTVQTKKGPKYSIDMTKKGMSTDKYNGELLKKLSSSILGEMYLIVPRNLTLDEQIKFLKKSLKLTKDKK